MPSLIIGPLSSVNGDAGSLPPPCRLMAWSRTPGFERIPAVRGPLIEPRESTLKRHSRPTSVDGRVGQGAVIRAGFWHMAVAGSRQFVEHRPRFFEVGGVEAFGEPGVDGCQKVAGFGIAALVAAEPGEARGGA